MWILMNDSFLSIVEHTEWPGYLLVRARRKGDIEAVFPGVKVQRTPERDYLYRVRLQRDEVAAALAERVLKIDYPNFKDSVKDPGRHAVYFRVWSLMLELGRQALSRRQRDPWAYPFDPDEEDY